MKTNLKINLGGIKIQGTEVKDINVEVGAEYTIGEVRGCFKIVRDTIKELPETLVDLKKAYDKFEEICEEATREEKNKVIDSLKRCVATKIEHRYPKPIADLSKREDIRIVNQNNQKMIYTTMEQDKIFAPNGINLMKIFHETVLLNEALEVFSATTRNKLGQIILIKNNKNN